MTVSGVSMQISRNDRIVELLALRFQTGSLTSPMDFADLIKTVEKGRFPFFFDAFERPCGYVACAMICKESLRRLITFGVRPNLPSEWNEGHLCLIVDVAGLPKQGGFARVQLEKSLQWARVVVVFRRNAVRVYSRSSREGKLKLKRRYTISQWKY